MKWISSFLSLATCLVVLVSQFAFAQGSKPTDALNKALDKALNKARVRVAAKIVAIKDAVRVDASNLLPSFFGYNETGELDNNSGNQDYTTLSTKDIHSNWNPNIQCADPYWQSPPTVINELYTAELHLICTVNEANGGSIPAVKEYFTQGVVKSAETVHAGPIEETFEELPASFYDTTEILGAGTNGAIRVRGEGHVASNLETRALYQFNSTAIDANGNGKFLRRLNVGIVVDRTGRANYQIKMINFLELKKPWYAPEQNFITEASKTQFNQFVQKRDQLAPEIAAVL